jgi:ANTAR domain/GAF domain
MDREDPFSRELRSARDRIAELQRRSGADPGPGDGLLPQVLAELDVAIEELSATGEELREQTEELTATRRALEAERQRYQELFEAVAQDSARRGHLTALEGLDPAADLDGIVQVVLDAGVRLLGVDGIGLMLADTRGRLCAAGASDGAVLGFLRAQEHAVKGPCVHAFLLEQTVKASSLSGDPRWAALAEAAAVHAVGAALATPIGLYGGPVGVCLVVSATPRAAWTEEDVTAAQGYASVLAVLLELVAETRAGAGPPHWAKDMLVREQAVVEQAKGALMARRGIDADAAALQLSQLARRSGRPLAEVAASLLRRLGAGPPERGGPRGSRLG